MSDHHNVKPMEESVTLDLELITTSLQRERLIETLRHSMMKFEELLTSPSEDIISTS